MALFQACGTVAVCSDQLNSRVNGSAISSVRSLRTFEFILSGPGALNSFED